MKIGLLNTNDDPLGLAAEFLDDAGKFERLLQPTRPDWTLTPFQVTAGEWPDAVDACDGYVITGSPASACDKHTWIGHLNEFIRDLDRHRTPTIGVCFGHQAIARALGGAVEKSDKGWGMGIAVTHYRSVQPWMTPARRELSLYASHQDQVVTLPDGADLLGANDFCPNAAFAVGDHIMTTQYHPEITPAFIERLIDIRSSFLPADVVDRAREQIRWKEDGVLFAEWMARFFEMPR